MKRLQLKSGSNGLKGSKFKRKIWAKNKAKIEANARYGYNNDEDEEAEANLNHNLVGKDPRIGKFLQEFCYSQNKVSKCNCISKKK